jgi:hypothetical protein
MTRRYVLAPEAALDLVQIWRYIKKQSSVEIADRVESVAMLWYVGELRRGRAFTGSGEWRVTRNGKGNKEKRDSSLRRPTLSQERKRKKKSACSVRNDRRGEGAQEARSPLIWRRG